MAGGPRTRFRSNRGPDPSRPWLRRRSKNEKLKPKALHFAARDQPAQYNSAVRIATVRVVLCIINFGVIALDKSLPGRSSQMAFYEALVASTLFLVYSIIALEGLRSDKLPIKWYQVGSPFADVLLSSVLIMSTGGYLSPFNLWFVFAVLASGFTNSRALPLIVTVTGAIAHSLIALIPQTLPLDTTVFAVRTGYLFGFAGILGVLNSNLSFLSGAWSTMEALAHRLSLTTDREALTFALFDSLERINELEYAKLTLNDGRSWSRGDAPARQRMSTWPLLSVGNELAHLEASWKGRLGRLERSLVSQLCDRTASALARVQISEGLVRAATREERLRLADELHDTYLQTLAAVDLHVEAIRARLGDKQSDVDEKLLEVKQIARRAAKEARETFTPLQEFENYGRDEVLEAFAVRWAGTSRIRLPEDLVLDEEGWRVVSLMVREGLHNASKHGKASHVEFSAEKQEGAAVFKLTQTGSKIEGQVKFGYGLSRLKEAVEREGGMLSLENSEVAGTMLTVTLPLQHAEGRN